MYKGREAQYPNSPIYPYSSNSVYNLIDHAPATSYPTRHCISSPTLRPNRASTIIPLKHSLPINQPLNFDKISKSFAIFDNSSDSIIGQDSQIYEIFIKTTKKYKPVALKIKPVGSDLPSKFRIVLGNSTGQPNPDGSPGRVTSGPGAGQAGSTRDPAQPETLKVSK